MRRDFSTLEANEMLGTALARIHESEGGVTAPVMHRNALVGLLTADKVNEFVLIVSALGEDRSQPDEQTI
jgi:hypothetical protein